MRRTTYRFDQALIRNLVDQAETKEPSGRLSASRLTWPTQWQVLWTLKVPTSPEPWQVKPDKVNTFHFRHFARGKQCEDWLEKVLPPLQAQVECSYRDWVGYADRIDPGTFFGVEGDVPHEIKSVKADKWYKMFQEGDVDVQYDHVLQANFYGLALKTKHFALTYLKSDTLESKTFVCDTVDYKADVDKSISDLVVALTMKTIPRFKAKVEYQKNPKYNQYWEYMEMDEKELQDIYNKYGTNKISSDVGSVNSARVGGSVGDELRVEGVQGMVA